MLIYFSIYVAAVLEGEIYYIAMCAAAAAGRLRWEGVLIAGALGGATGDQFWFYLLRGRIHWLDRYPWMARHRDAVVHRVKDNEKLILLISRFLPGLRTAIPIASAYAGVKPLHFSLLNLVSAFLWASAIMRGAPVIQDFLETTLRDWVATREVIFKRWIASGKLRPIEPRNLLSMIWASTQHYADFSHQIAVLNDGRPLTDAQFEAAKQQVISMILRGTLA